MSFQYEFKSVDTYPTPVNDNNTNMPSPINFETIETILGRKGTLQDGVIKITFPRYDIIAAIGNIPIEPESFSAIPFVS
jgi:hypothetical protein